jgi:hypothetical protein
MPTYDKLALGKKARELIMVNPADWKEFKQYRYNQYILKKLKEVEIVADDPSTWLSEEEFWGKADKL